MPANSRSKKSSRKVSKKAAKKAGKKVAKKAGKKVAKKAGKKATRKVGKKAAKKAGKKTTRRPQGSRQKVAGVSAEARHKMIATAAYYRAEKRHFQNGDPVADWLFCEKEVDALLSRVAR